MGVFVPQPVSYLAWEVGDSQTASGCCDHVSPRCCVAKAWVMVSQLDAATIERDAVISTQLVASLPEPNETVESVFVSCKLAYKLQCN